MTSYNEAKKNIAKKNIILFFQLKADSGCPLTQTTFHTKSLGGERKMTFAKRNSSNQTLGTTSSNRYTTSRGKIAILFHQFYKFPL
jgi:hypothetical protein